MKLYSVACDDVLVKDFYDISVATSVYTFQPPARGKYVAVDINDAFICAQNDINELFDIERLSTDIRNNAFSNINETQDYVARKSQRERDIIKRATSKIASATLENYKTQLNKELPKHIHLSAIFSCIYVIMSNTDDHRLSRFKELFDVIAQAHALELDYIYEDLRALMLKLFEAIFEKLGFVAYALDYNYCMLKDKSYINEVTLVCKNTQAATKTKDIV